MTKALLMLSIVLGDTHPVPWPWTDSRGTTGQCLVSAGSSNDPDWGSCSAPALGASASTSARALNTNFKPSTTLPVWVSYSIAFTCTASLAGGQTSAVELRSDTATTPTTVRATTGDQNSVSLAIAITSVNGQTASLTYLVPPNHNVRLASSGGCTVSIVSQSEVALSI